MASHGGNSWPINGLQIPRASLQFHMDHNFSLRREGRLLPPVPVVFALAQIFFAREPRVQRPPGLPCALFTFRGQWIKQNSGEFRRENTDACLLSSLRANGSSLLAGPMTGSVKQSTATQTTLDCFVAGPVIGPRLGR